MYSAGCTCHSIRFQFSGEPLTCYACHCTDCQTATGSAFALSMIVHKKDVEVLEGAPEMNDLYVGGMPVKRHHCAQCGTALWYSSDSYPDILALKPGVFEDNTWFKPVAHLWTRSAQPWMKLDDDLPKYEKQPELSELFELRTNINK